MYDPFPPSRHHDPMAHRNGHPSWGPPSPTDMLYRLHEEIGSLKAFAATSLENDRELFEQNRDQRERLATIEQRLSQVMPTSPAPSQAPAAAASPQPSPPVPRATAMAELIGLAQDLLKEREVRLLLLFLLANACGVLTSEMFAALAK